MHCKTVDGWEVRGGGRATLMAKPVPGRQPELTGDQWRQLFASCICDQVY